MNTSKHHQDGNDEQLTPSNIQENGGKKSFHFYNVNLKFRQYFPLRFSRPTHNHVPFMKEACSNKGLDFSVLERNEIMNSMLELV
jgi:hypothetical protein